MFEAIAKKKKNKDKSRRRSEPRLRVSAKRRWPAVVIISGNKDGDDGGDNDGSEDDNYKEPSDAYHEDDIDMHGIVKVVV